MFRARTHKWLTNRYNDNMTDLEKLALRRDRGYLVRLALLLTVSLVAGTFVFRGLTGGTVSGCLTNAFAGDGAPSEEGPPRPPQ